MAAEDELVLPQVPEAKADDPEDVSWALSTAEAMWARGDHLEGIKWVRKAAEAASDAEDDQRALDLAKAASELASVVARRSLASASETNAPSTSSSGSARPPVPGAIPLPSQASQPPPSPLAKAPQAPRAGGAPRPFGVAPKPPSAPPTPSPPRVNASASAQASSQASGRASADATKKPSRRRSRENLEGDARAAGVMDTAPLSALDGAAAERLLGRDARDGRHAHEVGEVTAVGIDRPLPPAASSSGRARRRSRPEPEPTLVASLDELRAQQRRSAAEWDASPTQNMSGPDMDAFDPRASDDGDRQTAFAVAVPQMAVPKSPSVRPPSNTVHDPGIQTSQAVRVVVWRDATGVHIAPAGTVVSAITIDAVLVALEPSADLTAWLSQRDR